MPKEYPKDLVQPMGDHNPKYECIRSECVQKYVNFPYPHLNPTQTDFMPYLEDHDVNIVLAAPTSSGKTKCIEFFIGEAIVNQGKKALYIAPMKALADEKYDEWTNSKHSFSKYNIEILTGDFILSEEKKKRLNNAKIIILTPEMFNSKCRNYDQHEWLKNTVFVGDEIHLIGSAERGDSLEVGLIQYYENEPSSRALFVSATIPNVSDFKVWLEHLTKRKTVYIKSDYRPCKLNVSWLTVDDLSKGKRCTYSEFEIMRMEAIIQQVKKIKDHPTLVFVGSKDFGGKLNRQLNSMGIDSHFHNADLDRDKRKEIEDGFRNLKYKVLVSSPTLAWGCNLPARYVIMSHTAFGLTPMEPSNIHQSMGRAGRAGYASEGDAIIVVKKKELQQEKARIFNEYKVMSILNDINTLCFHILSYVVNGHIKNQEELLTWYQKTLASIQKTQIDASNAKLVLDNLASRGMIKKNPETGNYESTKLGEITARMYMSPLDVSDWFKNFSKLKYLNPPKGTENSEVERKINLYVALAFAECYQWGLTWLGENRILNKSVYMSKREADCPSVLEISKELKLEPLTNPHLKYAAVFYERLCGEDASPEIASIGYGIVKDCDRIIETLRQVDDQIGKNAKLANKCAGYGWSNEWEILLSRLKYGVGMELMDLVKIDGIGKVRAKKLHAAGIKGKDDIISAKNASKAQDILGKKTYEKIKEGLSSREIEYCGSDEED